MDKEAFLHQLELAVINNNKRLFIDTIFDLPADVIVGLTEDEFSRVITISRQIDIYDVEEIYSYLEFEGTLCLYNALHGVNESKNCILSKFFYSMYISISKNNKEKIKKVIINNAAVYCNLAEMNIDRSKNLEDAIRLCSESRKIFSEISEEYAYALIPYFDSIH
jgi:hypothetical protein